MSTTGSLLVPATASGAVSAKAASMAEVTQQRAMAGKKVLAKPECAKLLSQLMASIAQAFIAQGFVYSEPLPAPYPYSLKDFEVLRCKHSLKDPVTEAELFVKADLVVMLEDRMVGTCWVNMEVVRNRFINDASLSSATLLDAQEMPDLVPGQDLHEALLAHVTNALNGVTSMHIWSCADSLTKGLVQSLSH